MVQMYAWLESMLASLKTREDEGQGLVEYALIIVLVSVVAITGLTLLGTNINAVLGKITAVVK